MKPGAALLEEDSVYTVNAHKDSTAFHLSLRTMPAFLFTALCVCVRVCECMSVCRCWAQSLCLEYGSSGSDLI